MLDRRIGDDEGCPEIPRIKEYVSGLIQKAALFEFSLPSNQLLPQSGKDKAEYDKYVDDYFDFSAKFGKFLAFPFEITAVEDFDSFVIMEHLGSDKYRVLSASANNDSPGHDFESIELGEVNIYNNQGEAMGDNGIPMLTQPLYAKIFCNGESSPNNPLDDNRSRYYVSVDLVSAATTYIEEVIYMMDPENFIICKKNGNGDGRQEGNKTLRKTSERPVFFALGQDRTKRFLEDRSIDPQEVEPVSGYWDVLISEKYDRNSQVIYVNQHYKGNGSIEGKDGNRYQVWVKKDPVTIEPFHANK